ncbi:hypothetical protein A2W24_03095 [Microgenomates group bacterium RBG_16_45_19]|nr:MAG: hypothetical protein A2W24_03095 [Microgenomates group bacterium RBG_16_45_19]
MKCETRGKQKSLKKLRKELSILLAFVEQRPAYQVAIDHHTSYPTVTRVFRTIRDLLYYQCELEGKRLSGSVEVDEAYFGGKRKGKRGRGAAGKRVVLGLLERQGQVYTRVVETLTAEQLMEIIRLKTRKGSVFYTDTFRSYNSLHQFGKHLQVNHHKTLVSPRHNHINGIEGFWSYAKHKLYNYRGVSQANLPLYLKEMEYRYNHRKENILEPIMKLYFGYVSY